MELTSFYISEPLKIWQVAKKLGIKKPKWIDFWRYLEYYEPVAWGQYTNTPSGSGGYIEGYDDLYEKYKQWLKDYKEKKRQDVLKVIQLHIDNDDMLVFSENKKNFFTTWAFKSHYSSKDISARTVKKELKKIEGMNSCYLYVDPKGKTVREKIIRISEQNGIAYDDNYRIKIDWAKVKEVWGSN